MNLWTKRIFVLFVVTVFLSGCAVRRFTPTDLPIKEPQPTLTKEQIKNLEEKELRQVEKEAVEFAGKEKIRLAKQPKVSNVFVEADIRSVLMDIATQTGVNVIPDETVRGAVSVDMNDVPLETALKMVLFPGGYSFKYVETGSSGYYLIGSALPESFSFEPLSITKVVKTNIEAGKVLERLSDHFDPYVKANKDGNGITVSGPPDMVKRIETDIKRVDRAKRQIEISAVIAVIQWEKTLNLGMSWSDININTAGALDFVKGGALGYSANALGNIKNIVQMRDKRASVYVKAQPRLVVAEGESANVNLTEEHLFQIMSGGGMYYSYFTTKEVEVGVKMSVNPSVNRDGTIRLTVTPEVSDIVGEREFKMGNNGMSQKLPIIARRSETTNIRLENGETFALGGLFMKSKKEAAEGLPILGKIPILNLFVKERNKIAKDVEMVIFITPRIIR